MTEKLVTPQDWITAWEKMDEEFVEEETPFRLDIPDVQITKEWLKGRETHLPD